MTKSASPPVIARHRLLRLLLVAAATLIIVGTISDGILGMIFRSRLARSVEDGMGADFSAGWAWYIPPRGVSLHHIRISKAQPDGRREELLTASRVVLKLAEFPRQDRPLVISLLRIDSPSVTIISSPPPPATPAAIVKDLTPAPPPPPAPPPQKFQIRRLKINDGQIAFESPGDQSLVLDHISLDFSPAASGSHLYHFTETSDENAANSLNGAGSINVDDMTLGLTQIALQVQVGAILSQTNLSGAARRRLEMGQIHGTLNIHGSASIPMKDSGHATYNADIDLTHGSGKIPGSSITIDSAVGKIHVERDNTLAIKSAIANFIADSGTSHLKLEGGTFAITGDHQHWKITDLLGELDAGTGVPAFEKANLRGKFVFTGEADGPMQLPKNATALTAARHDLIIYPRDVSVQPPKFPVAVEHINGGPISFHGGVIRFQNLNATYGSDQVLLDEGKITLDDPVQKIELSDLERQIKIDAIAGSLICKQPGPLYPAALGKVIAQLRPTGTFAIGGGSWYAINRVLPGELAKPKADYFFRVSTAGGAFALTPHQIPLADIHADAVISPMLVDIQNLRAKTLGGTVIASTKVTPQRPVAYEAKATFYNLNLQAISHAMDITEKKPLIGLMYLKVSASGRGPGAKAPPLASFAANGEFQVANGNFGNIQTIRAAASNVTKADQPLDGQAAGIFSIRDEKVTLENCAVGNPLFGLEGSGTIGFDKSLNLHAVAAPLGDWREDLKRSNVPLLDGVGSDIAGSIQQLFVGAQRTLLWDIHISGTTTAPKVVQTAAPVITRSMAGVFGQLIRDAKDSQLIDVLRPKE